MQVLQLQRREQERQREREQRKRTEEAAAAAAAAAAAEAERFRKEVLKLQEKEQARKVRGGSKTESGRFSWAVSRHRLLALTFN